MSADFTPEKEDYKLIPPFKMQVLTNFPYIEADFDALTNYQLLCKVVEYLNAVIHNENEVTEQVTGLYNAYVALQNYVNTYFDNLDLQPIVDNKLDEMAEDGTLADMIAEYIKMQGQLVYNTVEEMRAAENIQNGSFLKTYGFYSYNDGGGSLYKARTVTNEDVIDNITIVALHDETLVAELIIQSEMPVECFGAKGDNDTDDHNSIQLAINKCKNIILSKTYKTTGELTVNNSITVKGYGTINSFIDDDESLFHILTSNVNIEDININITYTNPNPTSQYGGAITIGNFYMAEGMDLKNINIINCNIIKNINDGATVGIFGDSHNINIKNCYIKKFPIELHWSGNFLNDHTPDTKYSYHPYDINIDNCILEDGIGLYASGVYNLNVNNIIFKNNVSCIQLVAGDVGEYLTDKNKLLTGILINNCDFNDCTNHTVFIKGYGTWADGDNYFNAIENPHVEITNCNFNDSTTEPTANLLRIDYFKGLIVKNCNFIATTRYKHINATVLQDTIFDSCYFKSYYEPFNIFGCNHVLIENCYGDLNQNHGFIVTQKNVYSLTSTTYLINDLYLINNNVNNAYKCMEFKDTRNLKILNNMILKSSININLLENNENVTISGNRFSDYANSYILGHYNIRLENTKNAIIENNFFDGSSGVLVATTSSNIKVNFNNISDTFASNGQLIEIPSRTNKDVYLVGNTCEKNTTITGTDYSYMSYTENT